MFGWSHASQANWRPSREIRGAATKSDPENTTRGSAEPSAGQHHELVVHIAPRVRALVPLADADDPPPIGSHPPVGIPPGARLGRLRGDRDRIGPGVDPIQPLVGPRRCEHGAAVDPPGAAAILVHRRARVEPGRQHLMDAAIRFPSHDRLPPGLLRTGLAPPDAHPSAACRAVGVESPATTSAAVTMEGQDPYGATGVMSAP